MTSTDHLTGQLARRSAEVAATTDQPTIAQLIDRQRTEIARALPKHMDADRLARIAVTTIRTTPALMECSAPSLLGALMLCAQTGLEPGPLGHVYFVPRRVRGQQECQWQLGYRGIIELARRSGKIVSIEAREVCEHDEFEYEYGLDEKLRHKPYMGGDRGLLVAVYGLAKFTDGGHYFLVMSKADIDATKTRSASGSSGPWVTDYMAMARKTVIRRMAAWLPLSAEQAGAIARDEQVVTGVVTADDVASGPALIDTIAEPEPAPAPIPPRSDDDVADGEIVDDITASDLQAAIDAGEVKQPTVMRTARDLAPDGQAPESVDTIPPALAARVAAALGIQASGPDGRGESNPRSDSTSTPGAGVETAPGAFDPRPIVDHISEKLRRLADNGVIPKRKAGQSQKRVRYALSAHAAHARGDGIYRSTDLTKGELEQVDRWLGMVEQGKASIGVDDDGVSIDWLDGTDVTIPWPDADDAAEVA